MTTACVSGAAQKIDTFASENFVCVCCGNPAPDTAGLEAQRAGNTSCLPPFCPRGRQGSHWQGPTQRQRETPVYQANETQVRAIKEKLRGSLRHRRYVTHAGAESGARFPTRTDLCPRTRSREDHRRPRKDLLSWIPGQRVRHDHSVPSGSRSPDSLFVIVCIDG